jgi:hypothetical protein
VLEPDHWSISLTLLIVSIVYLYRAYRFGVHFARETYTGFLLLPADPSVPVKPKRKKPGNSAG